MRREPLAADALPTPPPTPPTHPGRLALFSQLAALSARLSDAGGQLAAASGEADAELLFRAERAERVADEAQREADGLHEELAALRCKLPSPQVSVRGLLLSSSTVF